MPESLFKARIGTVALAASLAVGCTDQHGPVGDSGTRVIAEGTAAVFDVAKPFKAELFTDLVALVPDPVCGAPPMFLNIQQGYGESTHLGRFTSYIEFCVDASQILDDGVLSPGETAPYSQGVGVLTAANGDELYLSISGVVLPSSDPEFLYEFQDPFLFTGGTGRFAGASGGGMTDSHVLFGGAPSRTLHEWAGSLVLPNGR